MSVKLVRPDFNNINFPLAVIVFIFVRAAALLSFIYEGKYLDLANATPKCELLFGSVRDHRLVAALFLFFFDNLVSYS